MEKDYMENIRTDINHLNHKITHLDDEEIQAAWKRFQEHLKHMNQLLVTERTERMKEREQVERVRKLERGQWAAKEMCLMSQMEKLRADLKVKDWQMIQARKMEELSREKVERLRDGEIPEKDRQMKGGAPKTINHEWIEKMRRAVEALEKESPEDDKAQMKKRIKKLEEANQQLQDELLTRDEAIEQVRKKWKAEKKKVEKICEMSDELRSKNLEVNARYKAVLKQKMEKLEREREMMRDPIDALEREIKESEDRILSAVPLMVMQKHRLMQELQKRVCQSPCENMSKKERQEQKKLQKKKEKELKSQKKAEEKRRKEQLKALKDTREKSTEKMSFWKRLLKRTERILALGLWTHASKRPNKYRPMMQGSHSEGYCLAESVGVSCSPQTICALRESEVKLKCSFSNINIKTIFWFSFKQKDKWRNEGHPEDLALDSDYTGRVSTESTSFGSTLTIRELRERDSGEYHLMIITEQGEKHLNPTAVSLTVTDLQVKQNRPKALTCSTSCTLTSVQHHFLWYNNGSDYTVIKVFWHYYWPEGEPDDLSEEEQFAGRVEFIGEKERNCTLRMRDVRERDSGQYYFRIVTKTDGEKVSGIPGVVLRVTALQVRMSSSTESDGPTVTLMCSSTCSLSNNPTYIWYKNGQPVTNKLTRDNKLYLKCSEDTGNYSCAVRGHEELRSPDQTLNCLAESVGVSCSPQTICALRESEVKLKCSFSNINIKTVFWFSFKQKDKWRNEGHPEDLALDSDYTGQVSTESTSFGSTLTIRELRERDSGEYHLMIITEQGEKHLNPTAVSLTVTDLQVKQNRPKALTCSTSCTLTSVQHHFLWYNNGRYTGKDTNYNDPFVLSSSNKGSYTCSVFGYNSTRSSPLCISDKGCWSVTYTDGRGEPDDLSEEEQFAGRVEFIGEKERNCTLRMRDVRERDSGQYYFRIVTKTDGGKVSGIPGVVLRVTALQVRVISSTESDGPTVTLMCSSTCSLSNNPTYIWYKNGQPVTNKLTRDNKLYLKCSEDAGNYSCAVRGHEELRSPDQTLSDCAEDTDQSSVLTLVTVGVVVILAIILITAVTCMYCVIRRKRGAERDTDIQTPDPEDHTYTALNPTTKTSDYDTLQPLTDSPSDTCTALNPETMCSD
ncbi:hypothetical protein MHYP_G00299940 [Metynnis hypsauchen]